MDDDVLNQLQSVAERLEGKDHTMIDPVEFGEIKGAVAALQSRISDLATQQAAINAKVDMVLAELHQARGGWKMMMLLGGGAGTLGASIASFFWK